MVFNFTRNPIIFAACLGVSACAGGNALPKTTALDVTRAEQLWPGATAEQLSHGRTLYLGHCTSCHLPVAPSTVSAREWPSHVREMKTRAGLSDAEIRLVERYLVTIASRSGSVR